MKLWHRGQGHEGGEKRPFGESWRRSRGLTLATIAMAVFTDTFLYAMIVPVMPFALKTRIGLDESRIQSWVSVLIAVYGGAVAFASPLCGWACDQVKSRRLPLMTGLIALSGATLLLHLGLSVNILIVARILQGMSAAVVWVVGMALLADITPPDQLGTSVGIMSLAMTLGVLIGPLFGGFVFERAGYHAVFAMAYGFLALDIILRLLMLEPPKFTPPKDIGSPVTTNGFSEREKDKDSIHRISCISDTTDKHTTSAILGTVTSIDEKIQSEKARPVVVTLLRSRRMIACLWGITATGIIMSQFDSSLPIFVKKTFNWQSTAAGLIFLPITLTAFFAPPVGWAIDKLGTRWFAAGGFLLIIPFEILLRVVDHNDLRNKVMLCFFLTMVSTGVVFATPALLVEITAIIQQKEARHPGIFGSSGAIAQAYGLFNFSWALGSLIGPLWAGLVVDHAGWKTMTWTMALLSFISAFPAMIWTGGSIIDCSTSRRSIRAIIRDVEQA